MPNLIAEYRDRHNSCSIPLCHDGVCFFNKKNRPALIVLTSLACRPVMTCEACSTAQNTIIVEVFKTLTYGITPGLHDHVTPESDLISLMSRWGHGDLKPHCVTSSHDAEIWLWNFCTKGRIRNFTSHEADIDMKAIEQMLHVAQRQPKVFGSFYAAYETFFPKRHYLLHK